MRLSEVLGAAVVDADGVGLGAVHDCRVRADGDGFAIEALIVGNGWLAALATVSGFVAGRAERPWPLRLLAERGRRRTLVIPVERVREWHQGRIALDAASDGLGRVGAGGSS